MQWMQTTLRAVILMAAFFTAPLALAADDAAPLEAEPVVNVNQAGAEELAEALTGVGEKKADRIVQYREKHGDFMSASGLAEVKGIGNATVSKNQDRIRLK